MPQLFKAAQLQENRKYIGKIECAAFCVLSFLFVAAPHYGDTASLNFTSKSIIESVIIFLLLILAYVLFCALLDRPHKRTPKISSNIKNHFDVSLSIKSIVFVTCILFICWLPYAVSLYPGVVFFDTSFQLGEFFGNPGADVFPMVEGAKFTDHHPLFDTLLFGLFVKLGATFGSANLGMFGYLIMQSTMTALSFSYAIAYMREKLHAPRGICFAAIAFFALCPIIPVFVFSMTKDSLFSWLYVIFLVQIVNIVKTHFSCLSSRKYFLAVLLVCILLGLTKKTGIYIVFLTVTILCLIYRRYWAKALTITLLPAVIVSFILPLLVFPILNVSPGSKVESLGFLYQQTARYVLDYPDDVTLDEQEAISEVLDYDKLAIQYSPDTTNTIKNIGTGANFWPTTSQIANYFKCYVSEGLRHPDAYFNAIASLESGWFDWSDTISLPTSSGMPCEPDNSQPNIYRPSYVQTMTDTLSAILNHLENFPLSSLFFKAPLYSIIIPIFPTLYLAKKRRAILPVLIPVWIAFLLLLVSPVSAAANAEAQRYLLPFVYIAPFLIMLCAANPENNEVAIIKPGVISPQSNCIEFDTTPIIQPSVKESI